MSALIGVVACMEMFPRMKFVAENGGTTGEIALPQEETVALSKKLAPRLSPDACLDEEELAQMSICAVNLAYYFYEGQGGDSFLRYLRHGDLSIQALREDVVGPKMENFLYRLKMIAGFDSGAWRYIRLILSQAVITEHYKKSLLFYLKRLDAIFGLEKLNDLPFVDYLESIEHIQSQSYFNLGIFARTLKTLNGFNLIQSIAVAVDWVRSGQINKGDLLGLPGFREGFWEGLEGLFERSEPKISRPYYPRPYFAYNPNYNMIGIVFDGEAVRDRWYDIHTEAGRSRVKDTFFVFEKETDLNIQILVPI